MLNMTEILRYPYGISNFLVDLRFGSKMTKTKTLSRKKQLSKNFSDKVIYQKILSVKMIIFLKKLLTFYQTPPCH